jgi:hypothetical protein
VKGGIEGNLSSSALRAGFDAAEVVHPPPFIFAYDRFLRSPH